MKKDIIVQRAKETIKDLQLTFKHGDNYRNACKEGISANSVRKKILWLANEDPEENYVFVEKVLKQINLLLL